MVLMEMRDGAGLDDRCILEGDDGGFGDSMVPLATEGEELIEG